MDQKRNFAGAKQKIKAYLLLLPFLAAITIFIVGVMNAFLQSLGYIPALGLNAINLDYYREVLTSPNLLASIKYSLCIAMVSSVVATILGVMIAAALIRSNKVQGATLELIRLPILVPHTIVALMVMALMAQTGLLARVLYHLGLITSQGDFYNIIHNERGWGVIIAYIWKEAPFVAYFVLALMQAISQNLTEAARNLGASPARAFFTVTLPLSMPAIASAFIMIFTFSFGAYELPYLLGTTLPKALPVQAYLEYIHPDMVHRPYAMALNGIMIILTGIMALIYFYLFNKIEGQTEGSTLRDRSREQTSLGQGKKNHQGKVLSGHERGTS